LFQLLAQPIGSFITTGVKIPEEEEANYLLINYYYYYWKAEKEIYILYIASALLRLFVADV